MPDSASRDLQRTGVRAVVRRTYHSVIRHRVVDAAASLTFFALLTVFPTALAVVSALSIVDRKGDSLTDIVEVLGFIVRPETAQHLEGPLRQLLTLDNPWLGFTIGVVLTLWSLSGYATAFGRAMNTAYEVEEGRRIWKFRSMMLLVTLLVMVGGAVAIVILLGTPTISEAVIRQLGWAPWIDDVWNVVKWPVLAADLVVMVAVLYYATPNVKTPQLRWVSAGAAFAIVTWAIATVGFALYVETLGGGNRAYGWLGGAILLLVYLYISNFVLVVGGELDSEVIRMRQLLAGIEADESIRLPLRDVTRNFTLARWRDQDIAAAQHVRAEAARVAEDEDDELTPNEEHLRAMAQQVRVGERPLP
ncbi:YihY/virulence factor BrkB family protein [Curtobacterium flaccumfaciens]|uniref:YihY/virulence factor BrkB family protein n=1 Tax=Curtobacterium flaccumfaciens TaxID=2035 RepID=UPI000FFE9000|nr:YihY/virulence factor BrkB family protein [Curtobacterium flaccumfaciens]MCS0644277.1 YihY/virulence factor BrkB family protein [Curtobacterium flaccumfaciens pv. flaccumfaciens]MCS6527003.1 YihY/virulence factor BrkB family protein [Curtobacterium flaccumfaciens pv. flaccumfaciens]MCS6528857.1 YihY/virulence factor BrkB family protein [Curtobacterium flaccumfaciens pv. flaccumfaciens]NUU09087.1 YihY/virulence factor BrkB family protein [Curtobacterium flaccumfaciens]RXF83487.1 YihY/virulen